MTKVSFEPEADTGAILVTGGGRGLGRAIAEGLLAEGYRVVVADIDGKAPPGASFVALDLADPDSVVTAVARAETLAGALGGLINNAGISAPRAHADRLDATVLDRVLAINLRGTALVTAAVAERLIEHGNGGAIVTITSIGARQPTPGMGAYEASKAALEALTRSAALELSPYGVRANAVAPGPVITPMTAQLTSNEHAVRAWERRIPLGRIATTADIVPAVLFLTSPLASHITGTTLTIDGGQLLT